MIADGMKWHLVDVWGNIHDLSGMSGLIAGRSQGLFGQPPIGAAPPAAGAGMAGTPSSHRRWWLPKSFTFPMLVLADSPQQFYEELDALGAATDPTVGPIHLQAQRPNGSVRELRCHLASSIYQVEWAGSRETVVDLQFLADDPLWHDTQSSLDATYTTLTAVTGGRRLTQTIDTFGTAIAWPRWTITGPHTAIRGVNIDSGRVWAMDAHTAAADGSVTTVIETKEFSKSITLFGVGGTLPTTGGPGIIVGGGSMSGDHLLDPVEVDLWPFETKPQAFSIHVSGGTAATQIRLELQRRWTTC